MNPQNKIKYIAGQVINGLVFLEEAEPRIKPSGGRERRGLFLCGCEERFVADIYSVKCGNTSSCGCLRKSILTKHGLSYHRVYMVWRNMRRRCLDKKDHAYKNYGARGITVCKEWLETPTNFIEWAEKNGYN